MATSIATGALKPKTAVLLAGITESRRRLPVGRGGGHRHQVVHAAQSVLKNSDSDTVTEEEIRAAVHQLIDKEPNPEEIHQVAARLASVGWPLQDCAH